MVRKTRKISKSNEKLWPTAIGVGFVTLVVLGAAKAPNPSTFQYTVFRVVLALAAGGVAAILPGAVRINLGQRIRGVGAIAVFLIVYFFSPASMLLDQDRKVETPIQDRKVDAPIPKRPARMLHVAVLLNGKANYVLGIRTALEDTLSKSLSEDGYQLHWEEEFGSPDETSQVENEAAVARLLGLFPGNGPDYFITIGTAVSKHAKRVLEAHRIPQIFLGVTDPVAAGLVHNFQSDPSRANITGTTYPPDPLVLVQKLMTYFAGQRLGFIYSRKYSQDVALKSHLESLCQHSSLDMVFIETDQVELTSEQVNSANIFLGKYMLCAHIDEFVRKYPQLKFIAASSTNVGKGAFLSIGPEDAEIGKRGAQIIERNLINGQPLSSMEIFVPETYVMLNVTTARRLDVDTHRFISDPNVRQVSY